MNFDPLSAVQDAPLSVSPLMIEQLHVLAKAQKFTELPGLDTQDEQARLSSALNSLLHTLTAGLLLNPSKLWVLAQFQPVMDSLYSEDTEGKEAFGEYLKQVMGIIGIESSDGLLGYYLY